MKEVMLSDGRKAIIRDGKGEDLFYAYSISNNTADMMKILIARLTEVDGKQLTEDELDKMDIRDVMILVKEFREMINPLSEKK